MTDGDLLGRFGDGRGEAAEAAFAALMRRHGPMVLGVCRGILGDVEDAHDACQATFLVLARKAGTVRRGDSAASWLHGVARHVSLRLRAAEARRREHERRTATMREERPALPPETREAIHDEVARLPARFREPVVLCYLEGLTAEEAAGRIGCPRGTILSRLSRARDRLRGRLARRGVAAPAVAALLAGGMVEAAEAGTLEATSRAVLGGKAGAAANAAAEATARALARGVVVARLRAAAAALAVGGAAAFAWWAFRGDSPPAPAPKAVRGPAPAGDEALARMATALRQIGLAIVEQAASIPPPKVPAAEGAPLLSWRVAILPLIGERELYNRFHLDEPWDGPHNRALIPEMPAVFLTTAEETRADGLTHLRAFGGPDSAFARPDGVELREIADGRADTILLVEAGEAVPWTRPDALDPGPPLPPLGRPDGGTFLALFGDGAVRVVRKAAGEDAIRAAVTRSGGEPVRGADLGEVAP
ncbi:sigma-70 family RNA polymerase sigma factor [Aquisphaera giovannonii]|uniref:sigma-70 family RNA polymerase sigma factor n=1 Tax=Aquisphaera giovannonii TaxID=406548 RepID=UPI00143CD885|nr:sigma-70 family RNA polymerase sigma factor [Aquisphaera giovannonii]